MCPAQAPGILGVALRTDREVDAELTRARYGISVNVPRERAEQSKISTGTTNGAEDRATEEWT
jgi:hypothetical protein